MAATHQAAPTYTQERHSNETKPSYKTTELAVYILSVIGVLIASLVVDEGASDFGAQEAWFFVSLLTIGYMISRGLAKAGSCDHHSTSTNAGQSTTYGSH
jgi:hypothetical protein